MRRNGSLGYRIFAIMRWLMASVTSLKELARVHYTQEALCQRHRLNYRYGEKILGEVLTNHTYYLRRKICTTFEVLDPDGLPVEKSLYKALFYF